MWVSYVMLWTLVISFSVYSTVLKLIEAISQHCCTPIRTQSVYSVVSVSACIWVCCFKDIRTHTQLKKCTNGYYTLTQTYTHIHLDISVMVLETLLMHAVKRDALRPSGRMMWSGTDGVIRRLKTPPFSLTDKQTCPRMWRTTERRGRRWGMGGQWFPIRAGGLWLRAAARPAQTRRWPSEWRGCHGDRGASAWGRRPAAGDLPP